MLLSEHQERARRFVLSLRAGVPLLMLIGLIGYVVFLKNTSRFESIENIFLIVATIFVTIYFIFFLISQETQESLLEPFSKSYNEPTLNKKLELYHPQAMGILRIEDTQTLQDAYGIEWMSSTIYQTTQQVEKLLQENGEKNPLIGRIYSGEWIVATQHLNDSKLNDIFVSLATNSPHIGYQFASIQTYNTEYKKVMLHLKDLLQTSHKETHNHSSINADELNKIEEESIIAVKEHNLSFSFRPLYNIAKDTIDTYEVFVKLKTYDKEELAPKQYLPIINRLGLTRQYDLSIIEHILGIASNTDETISFSFNLSPFSLRDEVFQKHFFALLEATDIDPSRLIIQLYERKTHHNLSSYLETLQAIRDHGVRICIDNFGSSNASIDYMKYFRFDMVQFDRDYVVYLDDTHRQTLLKSMIEMSNELNITTVGKWVDTQEQKTKLAKLKLDYLQGFAIGMHITQDELLATHHHHKEKQ